MQSFILSGGSGTRLWPVSRASYPKQFCEFYDHSFLRNTLERLSPLGTPCVLTLESMQEMTARTFRDLNLDISSIYVEPYGRNTAPAVAFICHLLTQTNKSEEVVGIFPADHLVLDQQRFIDVIQEAERWATQGEVVTVGIRPRYPSTGYGYIEVGKQLDPFKATSEKISIFSVKGFSEKPDLKTAENFIHTGKYFWNSGMFIFKVSTMVSHFKKFLPEVWASVSKINSDLSNIKHHYANLESISLDYGVIEKLDHLICIPSEIGWSDVGSWDELARLAEEHPELRGDSQAVVFQQDSSKNYIYSQSPKVIGLVGVQNLIVVDTTDALLISEKGKSEGVKELVVDIHRAGKIEAIEHKFEIRPWGGFEVLIDSPKYKVKRITIDPGGQLSYQSHQHRLENWTIVEGAATVILDGTITDCLPGDEVKIPPGCRHRIGNPSLKSPLIFIEVQTGKYFGEDDIVRYEDNYGRM